MIVTSLIVEDRVQVDGRRAIQERHVDHVGRVESVFYLAEAGADATAIMLARVPILEQQASDRELAQNEAEVLA